MTRIAVAGFQHETNTFSPVPTRHEDFARGGAWPALTRGEELRERFKGLNLPLAGFMDACRYETVPILWTSAEPGGYVEDNAFDRICGDIISGIADAKADAVYLDLHGAMVTRSHEDGEAEILRRVRKKVGPDFPIAVSLDLHGNLSRDFFEQATVVAIYRTYPHIDIADTGRRAAELLDRAMSKKLFGAFRQLDFLIPITAQSTFHSPAREIYGMLNSVPAVSADFCMGFPPSDVSCCSPTIFSYAENQSEAESAAEEMQSFIYESEPKFNSRLVSADAAVQAALKSAGGTVVIADAQDNPGAGGTGETTGLLKALLDAGAPDAVMSMIFDPEAALAAHQAGIGSEIQIEIGGKFSEFSTPVPATVRVAALSDGVFKFSGPMYGGATANIGPVARLQIIGTGVSVVVGSRRSQNADKEMFRTAGIEPSEHRIVCVKSSVHFLGDYQPIASQVLFAEAPGANVCRLDRINYRRLRKGVRRLA